MSVPKELYSTPFDQFSRQYVAYKMVEGLKQANKKKKIKILDVGGYGGKTREFFPDDDVTVVDLYDAIDEPWYTKADGLNLPFKDEAYDVVVSFDVLEHIPQGKRDAFLKESLRVAKKAMILAAPFHTKYVEEAEKSLNNFFKHLNGGEDHQWLSEHIEYGLPTRESIESFLKRSDLNYKVVHSNNLNNWELLQFTVLLTVSGSVSSEYIEEIYKFYNKNLNKLGDFDEGSYRSVYTVYKNSEQDPGLNTQEIFKSTRYPSTELHLSELVFKHIAAMQEGVKTITENRELAWYKAINAQQQKTIKNLEVSLQNHQMEVGAIKSSKSWKVMRVLQLPRRVFRKIKGGLRAR